MENEQARDAYSKKEIAERLGIGYMTVHRFTQDGTIRTVRAGRRVLIPRLELERFLTPTDQRQLK
jgi:excisionase family DNA binding protein